MKIYSIDNQKPNQYQLQAIRESVCINCGQPFNELNTIIFVELSDRILWWHGRIGNTSCKNFNKKYNNKVKKLET